MLNEIEIFGLLTRLHDEGIKAVCCGGAARDTYLGREPKDYDFVILNTDEIQRDDVLRAIENATGMTARELGNDEEYVGDGRELEHVYESGIQKDYGKLIPVQFLQYTVGKTRRFQGDPYCVVEDFDNTLNYAWFEEYQGRLLVRVHPEFPSVQYGVKAEQRDKSDPDREQYMKSKFPEFF
jgi:hypothetical protein